MGSETGGGADLVGGVDSPGNPLGSSASNSVTGSGRTASGMFSFGDREAVGGLESRFFLCMVRLWRPVDARSSVNRGRFL